jgi:hypothetical protein
VAQQLLFLLAVGGLSFKGNNMSSVIIAGDTSGTITLAAPAVAGSTTLTLPATSGTMLTTASTGVVTQAMLSTNVAGNGPAFSATPSTTQSVTTATFTKVNLGTENFDTNSNFASSRFTPTVEGYYQLNGSIYPVSTNSANYIWALIYKNGAIAYASGSSAGAASSQDGISVVSTLVYLNGSTDYVELYCYVTGTSPVIQNNLYTQFSGFLARGA